MPISVNHFIRDDGQKITLTIYLCKLLKDRLDLSEEHTEYQWVELTKAPSVLPNFFASTLKNLERINLNDI